MVLNLATVDAPGVIISIPRGLLQAIIVPFWEQCGFALSYHMDSIFHIGVGSDVVCSTIIGNARASVRGTDNR